MMAAAEAMAPAKAILAVKPILATSIAEVTRAVR